MKVEVCDNNNNINNDHGGCVQPLTVQLIFAVCTQKKTKYPV
jgi:hypothetical protein